MSARSLLVLLLILLCLPARAQLADAPVLPGFGGLCDGGPLPCTRIDEIALHARADVVVAPGTEHRPLVVVLPYGLSFAFKERFEAGLSTHTALWSEEGRRLGWTQGPMRVDLKGLLWPFRKDPHRRLALVAAFQYEAQVQGLPGPNQLGLLTDLGALRLLLNKPVGLAELGLVAGGLWDWQGRYGTAELGGRVGLHLPVADLKVFTEALVRGVPALVRDGAEIPGGPEGAAPIQPHGVLAFGVVSRSAKTVDFSVVVQAGFGPVAPFSVMVRLIDLNIGKGYPRPDGLLIEMGRELGGWIQARIQSIDPYLRRDCVLYDDDHRPMTRLGVLSPDGKRCAWGGRELPIGVHFWRDRRTTKVCYDRHLRDCFMERAGPQAPWMPLVQPTVRSDCFLYQGGEALGRIGEPTPDGGCQREGHVMKAGQALWRAPGTRRVCDVPDGQRQRFCLELAQEGPLTPLQYTARRLAAGIDKGAAGVAGKAEVVKQTAQEIAEGTPVHATTVVQEATARAQAVVQTMRTATVVDATRAFEQAVQQGKEWMQKPAQQQVGDVVEAVGEQGVTAPLSAVALGGAGKVAGAVGEVAAEVAGKAGKAAAQVADHAPPLVKVAKKPKRKGSPKASPAQAVSAGTTRGGPGPVRQGQRGVVEQAKEEAAAGNRIKGDEITVVTSAGRRRMDLLVEGPKGQQYAVEVKTGKSPYTAEQKAKDRALAKHGGIAVGEKARRAGVAGPIKVRTKVVRRP
jgi:hypothetical protein